MADIKDDNFDDLDEYEDEEHVETEAAEDAPKKDEDIYASIHAAGFKEFLLKPELLRAIGDCGFEHPSEVQNECIPQAILGVDVLCQAKSGMGKTAVFVLSVLQQLDAAEKEKEVSTLVLCHTRELAYQICKEFERFKKYMPAVKVGVFYGGVPVAQHVEQLKNDPPHVVIGTPGRVIDLIQRGALKLSSVKHFVLDECDKMLETLDMRRDVQRIYRETPHQKQVMMFTATLSEEIRPVCLKFMVNPLEIYINDGAKLTLHGLQQYVVEIGEDKKNRKLVDLLDALDFNQCVIFVRSVGRANELNKLLQSCNFPSICIHSIMKQAERIERYRKFKDFEARIMVATNIFGRGIDIERVNVVFNYDMPDGADTYLHRVGRAGRFGTKGLAISFVSSPTDAQVLNDVQSRFAVEIPPVPDTIDSSTYMTK
eukprot:TRINITY_DN2038_c0_g3_i2.p1 TRINITY_DN2038_c0_g3~~TRINITY_DN2038_c0_g3_i2.p1  ORF type:complete len:443 (-),score=216.29 TRINITY_DN2038_c0_g3_i2:263-1543(-)